MALPCVELVPGSTVSFSVIINHDYHDINYGMLQKYHGFQCVKWSTRRLW